MRVAIPAVGQPFQRGGHFLGNLEVLRLAERPLDQALVHVLDHKLAKPLPRKIRIVRFKQQGRTRLRAQQGRARLLLIAGSR